MLLSVLAVSIAVYLVVRGDLPDQIDESLYQSGSMDDHRDPLEALRISSVPRHLQQVQMVERDGTVERAFDEPPPRARRRRGTGRGPGRSPGRALRRRPRGHSRAGLRGIGRTGRRPRVARSLADTEQTLRRPVFTLTAISVAAVGLAAMVGLLVAAAAVAPVHRVAEAGENVALTGELSHLISSHRGQGPDDLDGWPTASTPCSTR